MQPPHPKELLQQYFGFDEFRPGQREVMSALWRQKAALAVFPTGGGKSLCYQLPALMFEGVTLVVSPLIALMKDQIDLLQIRGIAAARLDSSLASREAFDIADRMRSGALKILYVAPERFNNERFLAQLKQARIGLFAVDEAHCISEWGHNFRPDYLKLAEAAHDVGAERVLALTATATPTVVEDICAAFEIPRDAAIVTGFYRANLEMLTTPVTAADRDAVLLDRIRSRAPGSTIVYVTLQKTAERVAALLAEAGLPARSYHAGMDTEARTGVQEWWSGSDSAIVVATIAFGMGIDKADVRYVYHYNLPKSLESYSQEIGRAGRDGLPSTVELLACPEDVPTLENFAYGDTPAESALRALLAELFPNTRCPTPLPILSLDLYDLSNRLDIRPLVLRTALTYLELDGILRQGTPYYAGYEVKLLSPLDEVRAAFPGEAGRFVQSILENAQKGRTWYGVNPDSTAEALGHERRRVVRALEVLEERGLAEIRAADVRHQYTVLQPDARIEALALNLVERFLRREEMEISRICRVLDLVTHSGCQVNALVAYFGEDRAEPCGHCAWCASAAPQSFPPERVRPPLPDGLDIHSLRSLVTKNTGAIGEPRQLARFLCGLGSPALTAAKLSRHELFGIWQDQRFAEILAWCESTIRPAKESSPLNSEKG